MCYGIVLSAQFKKTSSKSENGKRSKEEVKGQKECNE